METKTTKTALVGAALFVASTLSAQDWHTVVNEQRHYSVSVPSSWTMWDASSDGVISATTYHRSRAPEGGLVPTGEAGITIFPHKGAPETMKAWIASSLRDTQELRRKNVNLQAGPHGDVDSYVQVDSRYDTGPDTYYCRVTAYYSLRGQLFAAQLEFREGHSNETAYRSVLNQMVRSIKQLPAK
jgi:hypothetical protein